MLYFLTGNKGKFDEIKRMFPQAVQLDIDLPEIQSLDAKEVIKEKLQEAVKHHQGSFFVEDTSLHLDCLNGFPGPLIKWMIDSISVKGIFDLVANYENKKAIARTIIGYTDGKEIYFFSGYLEGEIVSPKGKDGFGWDVIFKPLGFEKTFGEMSREEKDKISMRGEAFKKMIDFIGK